MSIGVVVVVVPSAVSKSHDVTGHVSIKHTMRVEDGRMCVKLEFTVMFEGTS